MISLIICSRTPAKLAAVEAMYRAAIGKEPWELIAITDAASLAEGYNRGVERSCGDMLIFSHDDVEILNQDFLPRLQEHLGRFDLIGVAGTRCLVNGSWICAGVPEIFGQVAHPHDGQIVVEVYGAPRPVIAKIQAIDGLFIAARRTVLDRVHFDATTFDHFTLYDVDFSYQAYQAGLSLAVANDIALLHHSHGSFDARWQLYMERFLNKWRSDLDPRPAGRCQWARVAVSSREQALGVMRPSYWAD